MTDACIYLTSFNTANLTQLKASFPGQVFLGNTFRLTDVPQALTKLLYKGIITVVHESKKMLSISLKLEQICVIL